MHSIKKVIKELTKKKLPINKKFTGNLININNYIILMLMQFFQEPFYDLKV